MDANISVLSAQAHTTDIGGTLTAHVQNTGGPGTYKVEVWGIPHSPNGPDSSFGTTEPVEVAAGYDETVTWDITGSDVGPIGWLLVFSRNQGSAQYRQTDRFDLP